ncbi:hypothetical protein CEXT_185041 [Caerostris extrusa]|uniref:Uncharacterized protein n=1 Tax=Caerostris extrusa TaxID=172846 RepID=A0AAV4S2D9_CAEEX|nr:hypothetical protein CEXT_185041 [Caerostris extrusa]
MAHPPNASFQMQCSGTSRTDEISHFICNFNGNLDAPAKRISPLYETTSVMPILTVSNAQYNPMDPVPLTDAIDQSISTNFQKNYY